MAGRNKKAMFKKLHDRLDLHLTGWHSRFLSKAGKLTLVKAVAQAIPTYSMSIFRLPKGVLKTFHSKISNFWWGKGGGKRGLHYCKWDKLCTSKWEGGLGFRDLETFNQALLAKTFWRLMTSPTTLASRLLQAKYFHSTEWMSARKGRKASMIWSGLIWGKDLLELGTRWRIGDGRLINIKKDKWLPQPFTFKVISPLQCDNDSLVASLIMNNEWDVAKVKNSFFEYEADLILSIPLARFGGEDALVWHYDKKGRYSVKSGYWIGMISKLRLQGWEASSGSGSRGGIREVWKSLWNLNLPNKIKVLLWRACNGFLPCLSELKRRQLSADSRCGGCGYYLESVVHILWECPFATMVWKSTFLSAVCKVWKEPSFFDLFAHVCSIARGEELEWFGVICWKLWQWRNERVHGKREESSVTDFLEMATSWWEVWRGCVVMSVGVDGSSAQPSGTAGAVKWTRPKAGWVKLNVDGGLNLKDGTFGCGAVCRDENGECMGILAVPGVGKVSPYCCEILALRNGIQFCAQEGFSSVEIETDCKAAILAIQSSEVDMSHEGAVVEEIKALLSCFQFFSLDYAPKSSNKAAHCVAKFASSAPYPIFWWRMVPDWLTAILVGDSRN